jgi:hypothetical protein
MTPGGGRVTDCWLLPRPVETDDGHWRASATATGRMRALRPLTTSVAIGSIHHDDDATTE